MVSLRIVRESRAACASVGVGDPSERAPAPGRPRERRRHEAATESLSAPDPAARIESLPSERCGDRMPEYIAGFSGQISSATSQYELSTGGREPLHNVARLLSRLDSVGHRGAQPRAMCRGFAAACVRQLYRHLACRPGGPGAVAGSGHARMSGGWGCVSGLSSR